jgi:MFS family permease
MNSPLSIRNIRLFIAFRIFFNARFYYPVFSIFFLDFGLSLSQFAILNSVWAATIVLCEVPSGALADTVGRKNLMIFTGILMVIEMGILAFVCDLLSNIIGSYRDVLLLSRSGFDSGFAAVQQHVFYRVFPEPLFEQGDWFGYTSHGIKFQGVIL